MKFRNALCQATALLVAMIVMVALSNAQTVKDVVSFTGNNSSGNPASTPVQGRDGDLYGTSPQPKGTAGSIFRLTPSGIMTTLYTFNFTTGTDPEGGLTLATDGNLYGAAVEGGTANDGVLYRISSQGTYTVLHNFLGGSDGAGPGGAPIEALDGSFYGTAGGALGVSPATVYKYTRSGTLTTIFQFNNAQGKFIGAPVIQGSDGNLYGTASQGGASDNGSIYKLSTSGALLYLYSFPGGKYGKFPTGRSFRPPMETITEPRTTAGTPETMEQSSRWTSRARLPSSTTLGDPQTGRVPSAAWYKPRTGIFTEPRQPAGPMATELFSS